MNTLATLLLWADRVPCGVAVNGEGLFLDVFARGVYILTTKSSYYYENGVLFCFPRIFRAGVAYELEKMI